MSNPVLTSARALAEGIRRRRWSATEVVEAHVARIREVNPAVNAVVAPRFDEALAEAAAADHQLRREGPDRVPPLLGVPFTVKEFVAVRGLPNTGGILARSHAVAPEDATVVARLRAAGAIVLGVTNAPEGGLWHETSNPVYGRTRNPHDLHRTCGGSSGGEGAILAAGGAPFGIGSDTGGSLRIPAGFCGICSHKPTDGVVPTTGHFPVPGPGVPMVVGPMARHVDDLELVMEVIAGPDGVDARATRSLPRREPRTFEDVVVYPMPTNGRFHATPEVVAAVHKSAAALEARGARIEAWPGPDVSQAFELWAAVMAQSGERYDELVTAPHRAARPGWQAAKWMLGRAEHSGGVIALMLIERALAMLPSRTSELVADARELGAAMDRVLGARGLILHPVYPRTAPRHRAIALRNPADLGCTMLFNLSGGPVTVVRVDTDPRGLPIGVQVAAARGQDRLTLDAARVLEESFGVPQPITPRWGAGAPLGVRLA